MTTHVNPRHLSLAAVALALSLGATAPAAAAPVPAVQTAFNGSDYSVESGEAVYEEPLMVSFTDIEYKDPNTSKGREFPMFRDRTVAPGAYGQQDVTVTNDKAEERALSVVITNGTFTGDPDWTEASTVTWGTVDPATGETPETQSMPVNELLDADGNATITPVLSGTIKPGASVTVRIAYEVPDSDAVPYGNQAAADETKFSFGLIIGSNPPKVPETPIDTGSGFGWMQNLDEPHTWMLAGVGALLAAAGIGFRHSLRTYIHSAPKETTP